MTRSNLAADTRAASAALARPLGDDDRYLLIDDSDEDITQIVTIVCDGRLRRLAVQP